MSNSNFSLSSWKNSKPEILIDNLLLSPTLTRIFTMHSAYPDKRKEGALKQTHFYGRIICCNSFKRI